ncbi:oxysterol-binding protein-related protein 1-like protein [Leptotrombidium deliense]|uniref:Oxysterol-binding protein n=1 Tax=Leptotrombidium deliense TaxID=299467 RepID=A0A443SLA8_9ACAR|nr:oxysterol-binding protein-related protein 1-like protein [Leptotrombidium deliense]
MMSRNDISIWSILKHCIGKELSKITIPVHFNEPLSLLQRISENTEYIDLLDLANDCDDPLQRLEYVCAFAVGSYSYNINRLTKPFNPLLGETYELIDEEKGFRLIAEQVSHHPPISAFHVESPKYSFYGSQHPKLRFWGKFVEIKPEGSLTVKLNSYNETYTWKGVNSCVHNIIVGQLWFEQYGNMEIINHSNGFKANLNFKPAGWFGKDLHRVEGFITSKDGTKLRFVYGKWTDYMKSVDVEDYNEYMKEHEYKFRVPDKPDEDDGKISPFSGSPRSAKKVISKLNNITKSITGSSSSLDIPDNNGNAAQPSDLNNDPIPKSDSSHSLDIPNSKFLWKVKERPEYSSDYYNFTLYTMSLNEFHEEMRSYLPPTDCRYRQDVKALEEANLGQFCFSPLIDKHICDLDRASEMKRLLEEKQRDTRKSRRKRKDNYTPMWFNLEKHPFCKTEEWLFTGKYWDRDYSNCPDIFDIGS